MKETEIDVLLVEDNPFDAELTIRALRKNNITTNFKHVKDGAEALEYIFASGAYEGRDINEKPKVILLDLKMPRVDGFEVLYRVKMDNNTKKIPVVVLTSSKESPDINKSYELGANSYIVKPVEYDGFLKAVMEVGLYWRLINQPPV
jgi:two-component system response regulator